MGSAQTMSSPTAAEELVRGDADGELEIARRAIRPDDVAAALHDARRSVLDAGGDGHLDGAHAVADEAGAAAGLARVDDDPPGAAAGRAGPLDGDGKDALLEAHAPAPAARRALLGGGAGRRPRSSARLAGLDALVLDFLDAAERRLLEADADSLCRAPRSPTLMPSAPRRSPKKPSMLRSVTSKGAPPKGLPGWLGPPSPPLRSGRTRPASADR